jgi:DNA replication and repair protein RecF
VSLVRLKIEGVRNLAPVVIQPGANINWFQGPNGAGKTSVLEAVFLLARGKSFRSHRISSMIQHGEELVRVVGHRAEDEAVMGMERSVGSWRGRIGGQECQRLSEFAVCLPLVLMQPDSHRLIDGSPENRRQYLDWQLFHVEQTYLPTWQRYARYLRQRNAALKAKAGDAVLRAVEGPMAEAGERMSALRAGIAGFLLDSISELAAELGMRLPEPIELRYRAGFDPEEGLVAALHDARARDRDLGYTRPGPHRADLLVTCGGQAAAQELSRGQQKLMALLLLLAQLRSLQKGNVRPLLLLDDPVSELDQDHFLRLLTWLEDQPAQVWVTSTEPYQGAARRFHVEQGRIEPVV